jgi:hypothetical protein
MAFEDRSVRTRRDTIDHRSSRASLWLHERRIRIALWIALIEGLLVVLHVINRWAAIGVAVVIIALWFIGGRSSTNSTVRQLTWILAVSQAALILVPIVIAIVGTVALILVGIIAVVALVALFAERPA